MRQGIAVIVAGLLVATSILVDGYLDRQAEIDRINKCIDITLASKGLRGGADELEREWPPEVKREVIDQEWIECAKAVR